MLRATPRPRASSWLALAEFATNNVVNMATRYNPFFLNSGDHPLVPSIFMHSGGVSNQIEGVQMMVDQMKTALEEAQAKSHHHSESGQITSGLLAAQ